MVRVLVVFAVASMAVWAQVQSQAIETIECPFPDGQVNVTEQKCSMYSACQWTGSRCHMRGSAEIGYVVANGTTATERGFTVELRLIGPEYPMFQPGIQNLIFEAIYHEDYHVQIKIYDRDNNRYEVPIPLNFPAEAGDSPMYEISVSQISEPFSFMVSRNSGGALFSTVGALTFENQFIQFTTQLASTYLYGFGESTHQQFRRVFDPRESYPIFARDQAVGTEPNMAEYGHQPYYMSMEDDEGNSHSVLYYASNAMEYSTFYLDDDQTTGALTLRAIGGIIDLHFFLGPTPEDTTIQYLNMIGKPIFPPYYFLGFQISRWGYENTDHIREVRDRMKLYEIPQDIQVFDIDYMDEYRDFTIDAVDFWDLDVLVQELHNDSVMVTTILDPAIVTDIDNYPPYCRGVDADAFIKWMDPAYVPDDQPSYTADYVVGYVWPNNKTVFPDFFKPSAQEWWINETKLLKDILDFDVMWIDMNEPANFGTDMDRPWNYPENESDWSLKCPYNELDSPYYPTMITYTGSSDSYRISDHTICMSTLQTDDVNVYKHYDVHSLYGYTHLQATYRAMQEIFPGKRTPILVRSTFPGSGRYGVHWLGDNTADWQHLKMSIWGMFEFNMFGMPYVGADICGFFGDTTEELCMRWTQVGAFYPFSRNHNADNYVDQDPGMWESVGTVASQIIHFRYKYNPYLYTLFFRAHVDGSTVIRPLLVNWPNDIIARDIDDQFMWGDGMMITPIMDEGAIYRDVYFPQGSWYNMISGNRTATGDPTTLNVSVPLEEIPVYVRGGRILPFQEPAINTNLSRQNPFGLLVAIEAEAAFGEIYWDDGDSEYSENTSYLSSVEYEGQILNLGVERGADVVDGLNIETIQLFGFSSDPSGILINGIPSDNSEWIFNDSNSVLTLSLNSPLGANLTVLFDTTQ